ncbi:hypothetical protein AVDCRST_MAG82-3630, partial [uncultured Rubrobacteraceae bacterium]
EPHARVHAPQDGLRSRGLVLLDQDLQRHRRRRPRGRLRGASQGRGHRHRGGLGVPGRRSSKGAFLRWTARSSPSAALDRTPPTPQARAWQVLPPHLPLLPPEDRGRRFRAARHPRNFASRALALLGGSHPYKRGL